MSADPLPRPLRIAAAEYEAARGAQAEMDRLEERIAGLRARWNEVRADREEFLAVIDRLGFDYGECGTALLETLDARCASLARVNGLPGEDIPTRDERAAGR